MCLPNNASMEEVYKAQVECLQKELAKKDKIFCNQLATLTKAIDLLKQTTDYLYMRDINIDLQSDIDNFLSEVSNE